MKLSKTIFATALLFFCINAHTQEVFLTRGDLSILKGEQASILN
jgi:hypothetical protein